MNSATQLASQLRNVGPKLAQKMLDVGIDSPQKLRKMGAIKAFAKMYPKGDAYGDFNAAYLYALEGAIRDCAMAELPEKTKNEFRAHAQNLQNKSEG